MFNLLKQLFGNPTAKVDTPETKADKIAITGDLEVTYTDLTQFHKPPPIALDDPACPYCGVIQDPPPQRRRKCHDCGESIHTWTDKDTRRKYLLTAEDADRKRSKEQDAEWRALNLQVIDAAKVGDWHSMKMAHFRQALMNGDSSGDATINRSLRSHESPSCDTTRTCHPTGVWG